METRLPGNNGFYLRLIVGDLNLTLPTSELKRKYKENYEKWKLCKYYHKPGSKKQELKILNSGQMKDFFYFTFFRVHTVDIGVFGVQFGFPPPVYRCASFLSAPLVLLYVDCARVHSDRKWQPNSRLVGGSSLYLGISGRHSHSLAGRRSGIRQIPRQVCSLLAHRQPRSGSRSLYRTCCFI